MPMQFASQVQAREPLGNGVFREIIGGYVTYTFEYVGQIQEITLQPGRYRFEAWGAAGGGVNGGRGGFASGEFTIDATRSIFVVVGGRGVDGDEGGERTTGLGLVPGHGGGDGGFNGGGGGGGRGLVPSFSASGGGGATHISNSSGNINNLEARSNIFIVAGGGGGSGGGRNYNDGADGGAAGVIGGRSGMRAGGHAGIIAGGAGIAGTYGGTVNQNGGAGGVGGGGNGANFPLADSFATSGDIGGGGGGGRRGGGGGGGWGGGGGALGFGNTPGGGGGGGGSNHVASSATHPRNINGNLEMPTPNGGYMPQGRQDNGLARVTVLEIFGVTDHIVTFNLNGAPAPIMPLASQRVADGGFATRPANPTWPSNYVFRGWALNANADPSDASAFFNFVNTPITQNTTLFAVWSPDVPPFTVTYGVFHGVSGQGHGHIRRTENVSGTRTTATITGINSGTILSFLATPDSGFRVRRWWVNGAPIDLTLNSQVIIVNGSYTVLVEFERIPYFVTLNTGAGGMAFGNVDGIPLALGVPASAITGQVVTFNAQPNVGYHFTGWVITPSGIPIQPSGALNPASHITMPAQNVVITATFAIEPEPRVTVQANAGGWAFGEVTAESRFIFQDHPTHVSPGRVVTLRADPEFLYRFSHWEVISGGYGVVLDPTANPATFTMPANNIIIEARFTPRERRHNVILLDVSAGSSAQVVTAGVQRASSLLACDFYIHEVAVVKFSAEVANVFNGFVNFINAPPVAGAVGAVNVPAMGSNMLLALQTAESLMPLSATGTGRIHVFSDGLVNLPRTQDPPLISGGGLNNPLTTRRFRMQDYLFWRQANVAVEKAESLHPAFYIETVFVPSPASNAEMPFINRFMYYLAHGPSNLSPVPELLYIVYTPAPPVILPPIYEATLSRTHIAFPYAVEGYDNTALMQSIIFTNTGNQPINYLDAHVSIGGFEPAQPITITALNPGESITLWVRPLSGLRAGNHVGALTITASGGIHLAAVLDFTVISEAMHGIAVYPMQVLFNAAQAGYNPAEMVRTLTIINTGTQAITNLQANFESGGVFEIASLLPVTVTTGSAISVNIQPLADLPVRDTPYTDVLVLSADNDLRVAVPLRFSVEAVPAEVVLGDLTGTGTVTMADLILMLQFFARPNTSINLAAADVNQDGTVDMADLILFLRFFAQPDVVLGAP
ncbi:MAG: glycine-rich protein [Defluviitaleaceae bacterium]|nr:glycine-rich protein [Defluviitaleaceae bacterium]MCL2274803.1 glycine-rich protein [Defluviitaleaceae bacterium]